MIRLDNEYIRALEEAEPQAVEECATCWATLYVGEEVVRDADDNYFCDNECCEIFHGIHEIILGEE